MRFGGGKIIAAVVVLAMLMTLAVPAFAENGDEQLSVPAGVVTEDDAVKVSAEGVDSTVVYGQEIILSAERTDGKILYTTAGLPEGDDTVDVSAWREYDGTPITVTEPVRLSACWVADDETGTSISRDRVSSWSIDTVVTGPVTADVRQGRVAQETEVNLSCRTEGSEIVYTTDGSKPVAENGTVKNGIIYDGPITIDRTMTVKAISYMPGNGDVLPANIRTFAYETGKASEDRYEVNDSLEQAVALSFPGEIRATIHDPEDVDYYSFTLENGADLDITLTPPAGRSYALTLLDETGAVLAGSGRDGGKSQNIMYKAAAGTYAVKVEGIADDSAEKDSSEKGEYELSLKRKLDKDLVAKLDFSEQNMLTAMTDKSEDGSGYAWDLGLNGGGNFLLSMTYFANWGGPVAESDDPYKSPDHRDPAPEAGESGYEYRDLSSEAEYHVQNALYLPNDDREEFIEHVKNAVYSYGAADIYMMSGTAYWTPDYKNIYIDDENYDYYIEGYDGGHIVTIVGWDDNYDSSNFEGNAEAATQCGYSDVSIPKPPKDGAFIVKNSWGEEGAGEDGYFYVSYYDAFIMSNNPTIFIADEASDNYNHQYANDIAGTVTDISSDESFSLEEKFVNENDSPELLKAVSMQLLSANTRYEISVTCDGKTRKVAEGVKKYGGFYTERLDDPVTIPAGAEFSVSVYLESAEEGEMAVMGVSTNIDDWVSCVDPESGVAFLEYNGVRVDIGEKGWFPCIRAYTCDVDSEDYTVSMIANEKKAGGKEAENRKANEIKEELPEGIVIDEVKMEKSNGAVTVSLPEANGAEVPDTDLPAKFDLRETGTLTSVKNQGSLGSCWTFAAIACVENSVARNGGFAEKIPENMMLSSSCERVLLPEDGRGIPVELTATLDTGDRDVSSSKIWWSVTGDTDSVSLDTTQSFSGEKTQVLTALKPGTVTVTATSDSDLNVKASCEITITNEGVESITLEPEKMTLKKGESRKIKAVISPEEASGAAVLWSSSDPHIANVDKDGNVTAISGGTAVITAKAGSAEAQCEATVKGSEAVNPGAGAGTKSDGNAGTSDTQNPALYAMICLVCAAAATGVMLYRRRVH